MTDLTGKKLLFLGCGPMMVSVVQQAKRMGVYTIAADYHTNYDLSPAKRVADEAWDVSWADLDTLETRCREEQVNGVFTGFSEFTVVQACLLCQRLGLPFYATLEQIETTRDKKRFKALCRNAGVPVVEEYQVDATGMLPQQVSYPVIVKPTDNGGSKGITVCRTEQELAQGIQKALANSPSKNVIVERFMTGVEVCISYTIRDGELSLSCMSDAIHGTAQSGLVDFTNGWLFPSKYLAAYQAGLDQKVRKMFQDLGVQNGFMFLSAFYQDGEFYFFEMGYRLGGGSTYRFISAINHVSYVEMMIRHALTGTMEGPDLRTHDDPNFKQRCSSLCIMLRPGHIARVQGLDRVRQMEGVLDVDQKAFAGDTVERTGSLTQTLCRVSVIAPTGNAFADTVKRIYETVSVEDDAGVDMVLDRLDIDMLRSYWED